MCIKHGISVDNNFLKNKQVKMLVYMFFFTAANHQVSATVIPLSTITGLG